MRAENTKWGTVPQILLWSLGALFRAAGKCPFTFGIQSPYSLQRVSAHQNDLNNLGKAPGVFSERALTLSEERLAVVDLHIRHPPAEGPQTFLISPYQQSGTWEPQGGEGRFPKQS